MTPNPQISPPIRQRVLGAAAYRLHRFQARSLYDDLARRGSEKHTGRPLVIGFFGATIGLGVAARLVHAGLNDVGFSPAFIDMAPEFGNAVPGQVPDCPQADDGKGPAIFVMNSPEIPRAIQILRQKGITLDGRFRILSCAWEQPLAPKSWGPILAFFDTVWAPSRFVQTALQARSDQVIEHVPYPLPVQPPRGVRRGDGRFAVLSVFDAKSTQFRKNPEGALAAFQAAFGDREDVQLILKASHLTDETAAQFHTRYSCHNNIRFVTDKVSDSEMMNLIGNSDVVLSLSRAEGFGLLAAEALSFGRPAIVTGSSGPLDYAACPGLYAIRHDPVMAKGGPYRADLGTWTEPHISHAAELLRELAARPDEERVALRHRARLWWAEHFTASKIWTRVDPNTRYYFTTD